MEKERSIITNATVLIDEEITVGGLRIFGSPFTPKFGEWAFMLPRGLAMRKKWVQLPTGVDILITHGPPHGVMDLNHDGSRCGCEGLRDALAGPTGPKVHVFGHIHEGYGCCLRGTTRYINVSLLNEMYEMVNHPIVFELP